MGNSGTTLFKNARVLNRGIGGDTTDGVRARLEPALRGTPSRVFLLIGANDLGLKRPHDQIVENADAIVRRVHDDGRGPELVLQSVMPRQAKFRSRIESLNAEYASLAARTGATYLDLWPALSDDEESLRQEFTLDGLHLNGAGYRAWTDVLRPLVGGSSNA